MGLVTIIAAISSLARRAKARLRSSTADARSISKTRGRNAGDVQDGEPRNGVEGRGLMRPGPAGASSADTTDESVGRVESARLRLPR